MRLSIMTSVVACMAILPYFFSAAVNGADLPPDKCPAVKPIENFDNTTLTGEWSYYYWNQPSSLQCDKTTFTPDPNGTFIAIKVYFYREGATGASSYKDKMMPLNQSSEFHLETSRDESYHFVEVVADSYIIFVDCVESEKSPRWYFVAATSTKTTPSQEVIDKMKAAATNFGISEDSLTYFKQETCN